MKGGSYSMHSRDPDFFMRASVSRCSGFAPRQVCPHCDAPKRVKAFFHLHHFDILFYRTLSAKVVLSYGMDTELPSLSEPFLSGEVLDELLLGFVQSAEYKEASREPGPTTTQVV